MITKGKLAAMALASLLGVPLPAQVVGGGGTVRDRIETAKRRAEEGRVRAAMDSATRRNSRASRRIPPGQLPPRGMCRVWIDGVPPGQQPPVESCAEARARAAITPQSRVINGDDQSFPGRGKGKFKNRDRQAACTTRDSVVVGGRVFDVCRDANGNVINDRRGRVRRGDDDEDDDRDDNDRFEHEGDRGHHEKASKSERHRGRGHGRD